MSLYTRSGDTGFASTATRRMIPKNSPVFSVLGALEEFNSVLGVLRERLSGDESRIVRSLQEDVRSLSGELSGGEKFAAREKVAEMEQSIDMILRGGSDSPGELPGEGGADALFSLARALARRAEREMVACRQTGGVGKDVLMWGNRLSDFLYALSRLAAAQHGGKPDAGRGRAAPAPFAGAAPGESGESFLQKALWLCGEVQKKAAEIPLPVVTAVCDAGGNPAVLLRADHAFLASAEIAANKAYTSVSLKTATEKLAEQARPGGPLYGIQNTNAGRIVIFGGGVPLYLQGRLTGGFGVSGGTCEQDTALGRYAETIFHRRYHQE